VSWGSDSGHAAVGGGGISLWWFCTLASDTVCARIVTLTSSIALFSIEVFLDATFEQPHFAWRGG